MQPIRLTAPSFAHLPKVSVPSQRQYQPVDTVSFGSSSSSRTGIHGLWPWLASLLMITAAGCSPPKTPQPETPMQTPPASPGHAHHHDDHANTSHGEHKPSHDHPHSNGVQTHEHHADEHHPDYSDQSQDTPYDKRRLAAIKQHLATVPLLTTLRELENIYNASDNALGNALETQNLKCQLMEQQVFPLLEQAKLFTDPDYVIVAERTDLKDFQTPDDSGRGLRLVLRKQIGSHHISTIIFLDYDTTQQRLVFPQDYFFKAHPNDVPDAMRVLLSYDSQTPQKQHTAHQGHSHGTGSLKLGVIGIPIAAEINKQTHQVQGVAMRPHHYLNNEVDIASHNDNLPSIISTFSCTMCHSRKHPATSMGYAFADMDAFDDKQQTIHEADVQAETVEEFVHHYAKKKFDTATDALLTKLQAYAENPSEATAKGIPTKYLSQKAQFDTTEAWLAHVKKAENTRRDGALKILEAQLSQPKQHLAEILPPGLVSAVAQKAKVVPKVPSQFAALYTRDKQAIWPTLDRYLLATYVEQRLAKQTTATRQHPGETLRLLQLSDSLQKHLPQQSTNASAKQLTTWTQDTLKAIASHRTTLIAKTSDTDTAADMAPHAQAVLTQPQLLEALSQFLKEDAGDLAQTVAYRSPADPPKRSVVKTAVARLARLQTLMTHLSVTNFQNATIRRNQYTLGQFVSHVTEVAEDHNIAWRPIYSRASENTLSLVPHQFKAR